jgi:hypothetical protein
MSVEYAAKLAHFIGRKRGPLAGPPHADGDDMPF